MTVTVSNTSATNTFDFWRNRTNELAHAMTTYVVTVNSNTAIGNASVQGVISANAFQVINSSGTFLLSQVIVNNSILTSNSSTNSLIDSFLINSYNTAEYLIHVKDNSANNFYSTKIMVTHDTNNSYLIEYGSITTNSSVGTFNAYTNATHVSLTFDSSSSNSTVKFTRMIV